MTEKQYVKASHYVAFLLEFSPATRMLLEKGKEQEWIGVDLDGTLAHYDEWKGETKIGKPIPAMVKRIKRWIKQGKRVKVFTARADSKKSIEAIKKWLRDCSLPALEVTNIKDPLMIELWDDRAVTVKRNTGKVK